jgi:hypothetical protein
MNTKVINDDFIKSAIENADRDQYGQVKQSECTPFFLFKDKEVRELVVEYLKSGKSRYKLQTYGGRFGTYEAISKHPF